MMYTTSFTNVAVTAAQDFFELTAPADAIIIIHSCYISQNTDYGDSAAEGLTINVTRYSTSGSGGTTPTPRPLEVGMSASGATSEANNTTEGGTPIVVHSECFNIQAGWVYRPTPEERIVCSAGDIIAINLPSAPTDSLTMSGTLYFDEIGG